MSLEIAQASVHRVGWLDVHTDRPDEFPKRLTLLEAYGVAIARGYEGARTSLNRDCPERPELFSRQFGIEIGGKLGTKARRWQQIW